MLAGCPQLTVVHRRSTLHISKVTNTAAKLLQPERTLRESDAGDGFRRRLDEKVTYFKTTTGGYPISYMTRVRIKYLADLAILASGHWPA